MLQRLDGGSAIMGDENFKAGFLEYLASDIGHEAVVFSDGNAGHG